MLSEIGLCKVKQFDPKGREESECGWVGSALPILLGGAVVNARVTIKFNLVVITV